MRSLLALTITAAVTLGVAGSASAAPQNLKKTVSTKDPGKTSWSVWSYCSKEEVRQAETMAQSTCVREKAWSRKSSGTFVVTTNWRDTEGGETFVVFQRAGTRVALDISWATKKSKKAKLKTSLPVRQRLLSNVSVTRTAEKSWSSGSTSCRWIGDTLSCGQVSYDDETWKISITEKASQIVIKAAEAPEPAGRWWDPTEGQGKWVGSLDLLPVSFIESGAGDPVVNCEGVSQKVKFQQGKWKTTKTLKGIRGKCVAP